MLVAATLVARKPVGTLGGSTSSLGGVVKSTLLLGVETLPAPSTASTWSTYLLLGVRLRTVAVVTLPPTSPTTRRLLGAVGGSASVGRLTRRRSTFGPPLAVVAVARTFLVPASRRAWNVASCQVSQLLVKVNASSSLTNVPLTVMSMG